VSTGLLHVPTEAEIERLYHELAQVGGTSVGRKRGWPYRPRSLEDLMTLAGDMLRFDARLLSILVQLLLARFAYLNPQALRERMRLMDSPQALLVALEFGKAASADGEFRHFADYVCAGWSRTEPTERFFLDAERPASRMAQRKLGRNLAAYARWGFVGTERPIVDAKTKRTVGRYDAHTRRHILSQLAETTGEFTLAEYLEAIDHAISRQQALADLRADPQLRTHGHGRGARWQRERASA
jgi:hypothetical protein